MAKSKAKAKKNSKDSAEGNVISTKAELKKFLQGLLDRMSDGSAASVHALSSMNFVMGISDVKSLFSEENKELARDIWLRLQASGFNLTAPPLFFSSEDLDPAA